MVKLPDRSIPRKLLAILKVARRSTAKTVRDLSLEIASKQLLEFSFFKPSRTSHPQLGYSKAPSIAQKVRFAVALQLMDDACRLRITARDVETDVKGTVLFAERTRDLLDAAGADIAKVTATAMKLLSKNPLVLPTSHALYAELKPADLSYRNFQHCLSILLFEPDGALGAAARRIYIPRTFVNQKPGEIGG